MKMTNELKAILLKMEALKRERTRAEAAYGLWRWGDIDDVEAQAAYVNSVNAYMRTLEKIIRMLVWMLLSSSDEASGNGTWGTGTSSDAGSSATKKQESEFVEDPML
jgi:hypothetical protein